MLQQPLWKSRSKNGEAIRLIKSSRLIVSRLCHLHTVGCELQKSDSCHYGLLSRQRIAINRLALEHPSPLSLRRRRRCTKLGQNFSLCGHPNSPQIGNSVVKDPHLWVFGLVTMRSTAGESIRGCCWGGKIPCFGVSGSAFLFQRGLIISESALRPRGKVFVCVRERAPPLGQEENVVLRRNNGVGASLLLTPATRAPAAFPAAAALIKKLDSNFSLMVRRKKNDDTEFISHFAQPNNRAFCAVKTLALVCTHPGRVLILLMKAVTFSLPVNIKSKHEPLLILAMGGKVCNKCFAQH